MSIYFLVALCFLCIAGCSKKKDADEDEEKEVTASNVEVSAARVVKGEIRQLIAAGGSLSPLPDHDVKVSSLVPGRVNQLMAQEGDTVKERQVLARIDDSALRDQLRQAKAALDNAEANAQRTAHLFERGIAAAKEKEDAQRDLVTAQSAYDTARIQ